MERDSRSVRKCQTSHISTHTLTWSVTAWIAIALIFFAISTHTLTWSVTISAQSSTLRGGISTHTLTWSVTTACANSSSCLTISTHTLTWSVTDKTPQTTWDKTDFNSHAHVERDMCGTNFGGGAKISTHTLTWSVTKTKTYRHFKIKFQLTRSRGA